MFDGLPIEFSNCLGLEAVILPYPSTFECHLIAGNRIMYWDWKYQRESITGGRNKWGGVEKML